MTNLVPCLTWRFTISAPTNSRLSLVSSLFTLAATFGWTLDYWWTYDTNFKGKVPVIWSCPFLIWKTCTLSSNRPHFLRAYRRNKRTRDVGRIREKLASHEPEASELQAFRVFAQYPKRIYYAGKPMENALYCFDKTIVISSSFQWVYRHNNP